MRIKLSIVVSDLLGASGLRILHALAEGETDPKQLALLGDDRLKCSEEQLVDALSGKSAAPMHRQCRTKLERLQLIDGQIAKLNGLIAQAKKPHQDALVRLAEVPGLGVDSAQQVIAEVGVKASTFPWLAISLRGGGPVPARTKVPKRTTAVALRKAINICGGCSTRRLTPAVKKNGSHFRQCSGVCYRGWARRPAPVSQRLVPRRQVHPLLPRSTGSHGYLGSAARGRSQTLPGRAQHAEHVPRRTQAFSGRAMAGVRVE